MASVSEIVKKPNVKPNPECGLYWETSRDRSLFPHLNSLLDESNESDVQVKSTCVGPDLIGGNQWQHNTVVPNVRLGAFPTKDYISADGAVAKATAARYSESHYSLVGFTSAPTFQFQDFELASRSELVSCFPKYESVISILTLPD